MKMETIDNEFVIDAVITWVDGSDEKWQKKINQYANRKIDWGNKRDTLRYNSIDEIDIAIKSVLKNAPFIRTIFLVTDAQKPKSFDKLKEIANSHQINLELVDHTVIFRDFEDCLPSFNSCSIITMLYRIPSLSEHFLIFNDDTFLMKPTTINDYFIDGYPVIRGKWSKYYEDQHLRTLYYKTLSLIGIKKDLSFPGYKKAQQKSAKLLGLKKYLRRDHTPVSLRKSTLENYFNEREILHNNVKFRFRNESQFIISSLSTHLEIINNTYKIKNNFQLSYFQSYKSFSLIRFKLFLYDISKSKLFMCFQNLELADGKTLDYILCWIDKRLK
jgi:hypothetical protein